MRNISFSLTTDQIRKRTKTVTRRLGWLFLKRGDLLQACEKCMGLKKGETIQKLGVIRVTSVMREPLYHVHLRHCETAKEGFPEMSAKEFIAMFSKHMRCDRETTVTRIEFEYCN